MRRPPLKSILCTIDSRRPRAAAKNGNGAAIYADKAKGYLALDANGILIKPTIYLCFEQARKDAGSSGRVVQRQWYERRMGCKIVEGK